MDGELAMDMASAYSFRASSAPAVTPARTPTLRLMTPDAAEHPAFLAQWHALVEDAGEPNPFFEPWCLLPALRQWGNAGRVVIKARFEADRLVGLMPVFRTAQYYGHSVTHACAWLHANAFCGAPLIAAGHEDAFWSALLSHFDSAARRAVFLHLPALPADGPAHAGLSRVLLAQGRAHRVIASEDRALLRGDMTAAIYLEQAVGAKKRKELRRQHARLAEAGSLTFERSLADDGLAEWTDEFLALEASGWKGTAGSALASAADTAAFFAQALAGAARAGRLERLALRLDGRAVAMLVNFITPPGAYSFKTAFDENYARYSPGMLLQLENLALLEHSDIRWADSCAAQGHPMIERLWRDKRRMISLNIAIGGPVRRALFALLSAYEARPRSTQ